MAHSSLCFFGRLVEWSQTSGHKRKLPRQKHRRARALRVRCPVPYKLPMSTRATCMYMYIYMSGGSSGPRVRGPVQLAIFQLREALSLGYSHASLTALLQHVDHSAGQYFS